MAHLTLRILDPSGLHTRPAARFVQLANRFESRIVIRHGDRQADAKSLIAILGLTVRPDTLIDLEVEGPDEAAALEALVEELAPYAAETATATPGAAIPAPSPAPSPIEP